MTHKKSLPFDLDSLLEKRVAADNRRQNDRREPNLSIEPDGNTDRRQSERRQVVRRSTDLTQTLEISSSNSLVCVYCRQETLLLSQPESHTCTGCGQNYELKYRS